MISNKFYVYLLISDLKKNTYIGATVDVKHRLRQHNKELSGGAIYTSDKVLEGEKWSVHCYISEFPTWQTALQFEWKWKQISRKLTKGYKTTLKNRIDALTQLLALKQSTSTAIPYDSWDKPPMINYLETNETVLLNTSSVLTE